MKGVIVICLSNLVQEKFGKDKWEAVLTDAGLPRTTICLAAEDMDDKQVVRLLGSVCKVLGITHQQAADAFGEYWMTRFAPGVYKAHFAGVDTAREFLLKMDQVHEMVTRDIPNAHPPRFQYEWKNDRTLLMTYRSARGLMDIFIGLIRGVGRYYREDLRVTKVSGNSVEVQFPS